MKEKTKKCKTWIKANRKKVLIAGASVGVVLVVCMGVKKFTITREQLETLDLLAKEDVGDILNDCSSEECLTRTPHEVKMHMRELPKGHNPSPAKLALAAERGIELLPGQTFVEGYCTGERERKIS